jgi:hypothetical protein
MSTIIAVRVEQNGVPPFGSEEQMKAKNHKQREKPNPILTILAKTFCILAKQTQPQHKATTQQEDADPLLIKPH